MRYALSFRIIIVVTVLTFGLQSTGLPQGASLLFETPLLTPASLCYVSVNSANPSNYFNFLLDRGDSEANPDTLTSEAKTLINYFFLGITLPGESFWVNLQPDQPDTIISEELGRTEMGKVLVEQDLELKKLAALYMHPNHRKGKEFWEKLYARLAAEKLDQEVTTSNRFWIVPQKAVVVETFDGALVAESRLAVMSENEFLQVKPRDEVQQAAEELLKEIIVPGLSEEVNTSATFAPLRQIFQSLILAEWFKSKCAQDESAYAKLINTRDTTGLESAVPWEKQPLWQEYKDSYQKGEYDIKAELAGLTRRYTSGGISLSFGTQAETVSYGVSSSIASALTARAGLGRSTVEIVSMTDTVLPSIQRVGDVLIMTTKRQGSSSIQPALDTVTLPSRATGKASFVGRLDPLIHATTDFFLDSRASRKDVLDQELVVVNVGIGQDGGPTVYDLARILNERGFHDIVIYAIDNNPTLVELAQRLASERRIPDGVTINFLRGGFDLTAHSLPKADLVIAANVLFYYDDDPPGQAAALTALRAGLKDDGLLVTAKGGVLSKIDYDIRSRSGEILSTASIPSGQRVPGPRIVSSASAIDVASIRQDLLAGGVGRDMVLNTMRYHGVTEALPVLKETLRELVTTRNIPGFDEQGIQGMSEVVAELGGPDEVSFLCASLLTLEPDRFGLIIPALDFLVQRIPRESIRFHAPARSALTNLLFRAAAMADVKREDRIAISEIYINAFGVPANTPGNRDLRAALVIAPRLAQASVFGEPAQIPVFDGAADTYDGASSSLLPANPLTGQQANRLTSLQGGIDFSRIDVQVRDQTYVSGLNPAERKILFAAQALRDQWQSLALLYVHELMLMWQQNISTDISNWALLTQVLAELQAEDYLDPDAQQFMGSLAVPARTP